jgi:hypothetical protein
VKELLYDEARQPLSSKNANRDTSCSFSHTMYQRQVDRFEGVEVRFALELNDESRSVW